MRTWVAGAAESQFPVQNLPYGVFTPRGGGAARCGVAIGEYVLDLAAALGEEVFAAPALNAFMAQGPDRWDQVRRRVTELLTEERHRPRVEPALHRRAEADLHLPFCVGDFVDFYASEHHAANLGRMMRPDDAPLLPNWRHLPVGYHGRAGTVVASGTPVRRPCGQRRAPGTAAPVFGPSAKLDFEAEVGFVVGAPSRLGEPVPTGDFARHVFGAVLVNDWSARDIQGWEYRPLGPFLGKSFATTVSPWVVPAAALEAARVPTPAQEPRPLPYLRETAPWGLDLAVSVELNTEVISRPPYAQMYWSPAQMLAHLTSNGASLRTGDLYASGTVSGPEPGQRGALIELAWNGEQPLHLSDGTERSFLCDGDTVTLRATAPGPDGTRIGFGSATGTVRPAAG